MEENVYKHIPNKGLLFKIKKCEQLNRIKDGRGSV